MFLYIVTILILFLKSKKVIFEVHLLQLCGVGAGALSRNSDVWFRDAGARAERIISALQHWTTAPVIF
jgi:hypothetical protein